MLVTLGAREHGDDVVDLLAACHRRIRHHIVLARRLSTEGTQHPGDEVQATAAQVRRYFAVALPLHVEDEELTLGPALAGAGPEVAAALQVMTAEHAAHQHLIARLVALCADLERDAAQLAPMRAELGRVVEELATELATHLELEERVVFPAVRMLPAEVRSTALAAIRGRRGPDGAGGDGA